MGASRKFLKLCGLFSPKESIYILHTGDWGQFLSLAMGMSISLCFRWQGTKYLPRMPYWQLMIFRELHLIHIIPEV